jgi:dipeptidyl aminopeptidase/acylaminoacyl peptidase
MTLIKQRCGPALTIALVAIASTGAHLPAQAGPTAGRHLEADDFLRIQSVENPACSADGQWAIYTVTRAALDADETRAELWKVNWAGDQQQRIASASSISSAAFSPDGRYVSYLAQSGTDTKPQITLIDQGSGGSQAVTAVSGDIGDYQWSPDGKRIVLSLAPGDEAPASEGHGAAKVPKPIVIDRLRFKQDGMGYLTDDDRAQLFLLDVQSHALTPLTCDTRFDDTAPAWSPDGRQVAFVSTRDSDPDRSGAQELYLVDARAGAVPRKLATFAAPNRQQLLWTADGHGIIVTVGQEARLNAYMQDLLAVVAVTDGSLKVLTARLDRAVSHPVPGAAPDAVGVLVEDDGTQYPAIVNIVSGTVAPVLTGKRMVTDQCAAAGRTYVVAATDTTAPEMHALAAGQLHRLSTHNDAFMADLALGAVEDISFRGADGAQIHGLLIKPTGYQPGVRYPTLLWIHGGPNGQDGHGLDFSNYPLALERQFFAAHGYAVLAVNYHGSSGRGAGFAGSIVGDWGNKEVADLLAAVDFAVQAKIADPQRLGIGGWSYGGLLTDYTIATDTRFKAGISGAGSADQFAIYGSDQFIVQYNAELGPPWKSEQLWRHLSYPYFHADRIRTPTLFMGGEKDFRVPIAGSEQMYAALRTLGVPTQLVVYPGQSHYFERPSYIKDRMSRDLEWFDRYLKAAK